MGDRLEAGAFTTSARSARNLLIPAAMNTETPEPRTPWWDDLDASILAALADGAKSPRKLGEKLGISESSVTSLLFMLAVQGRVRISRVERAA